MILNDFNEKQYVIDYMAIWMIRYNNYKQFDALDELKGRVLSEALHKINILNKGYHEFNGIRFLLSLFEINVYNTEISALIDFLNKLELETPCHQVFLANFNGALVSCEWDIIYKYDYLKPGMDSCFYTVIKKIDNYKNYQINGEKVKPFVIDDKLNILCFQD